MFRNTAYIKDSSGNRGEDVKGKLTVNESNDAFIEVPIIWLACRVSDGIQARCKRQKQYHDMVTKSGSRLVSKVEEIFMWTITYLIKSEFCMMFIPEPKSRSNSVNNTFIM